MTEHSKLVAKIKVVQKMAIGDRLKFARKQRNAQIKKWAQYDLELKKRKQKKPGKRIDESMGRRGTEYSVHFENSVTLMEAAARNDVEEVALLLGNGVVPDVTNEDGLTAMHQCCIDDHVEIIQLLVDYGANVNAQDSELWTPLHAAATCGNRHICQLLIVHGAELMAMNEDGNMPYDICDDESTLEFIESEMAADGITQAQIDEMHLSTETQMLQDLIEYASHDSDLSFKDWQGVTPLHIAAANGYTDVVVFLLFCHVLVDIEDDETWQPIHAAAYWGHLLILELLVQYGAELDAKTNHGKTPFDLCEDPEMKQKIIDLRVAINDKKSRLLKGYCWRKQTNTRRASIHRSSIRMKNPMFIRKVKGEAVHFDMRTSDERNEEEISDDGSHPLFTGHVVHESENIQSSASHAVPSAIANLSPEKRAACKLPVVAKTAEQKRQIDQMHISNRIYSRETVRRSSTLECNEWEISPEARHPSGASHGPPTNLTKQYAGLQSQGSTESICSLRTQVQNMFLNTVNPDQQHSSYASLTRHNDDINSVLQRELPGLSTDHENTEVGIEEKPHCCVII